MISSDQRPPGQDWLVRRVTDLERQVRELQAGRRLEAATIGAGGLTIRGGIVAIKDNGRLTADYANGATALDLGAHTLINGAPAHGMLIRRPGGELAFWTYGLDSGGSAYWALYDLTGNIIMSDDAVSGQGLATPYIPLGTYPTRMLLTFASDGEKTTSATFVPLWTVHGHKQHPRLRVGVYVFADVAGTSAEIQLRDNGPGTIIAGPTTVSATASPTLYELTGPWAGTHMERTKAELEVRRTAGTGTVWVQLAYAEGIQS